METAKKQFIKIETRVKASPEKTWEFWTQPEHIVKWNNASEDWHTPRAESDLREGGRFVSRMEAKDGSAGFDFGGTYTRVDKPHQISYTMDDGRKVDIHFTEEARSTLVAESFEPEATNPLEMQRHGWQNILDNFKRYVETREDA